MKVLQWDLFIKDTLGTPDLSTVERLPTLQRWNVSTRYGKSTFGGLESVLCREVISIVSSIWSIL